MRIVRHRTQTGEPTCSPLSAFGANHIGGITTHVRATIGVENGLAPAVREHPGAMAEPSYEGNDVDDGTPYQQRPTTLYRAFDSRSRLIYVGIAVNWTRRWAQHAERSPWFRQVARIELEEHANRADAIAAERRAVMAEHPVHNIEHTPRDRRPMRKAPEQHYYVRPFDYTHLASRQATAAHRAIGHAINEYIRALYQLSDDVAPVSQEDLASIVSDLVRTIPFSDCCNRCGSDDDDRYHYPVAVRIEGTQMQAFYYHEKCGARWRTFWNVDLPWLMPEPPC